MLTSFIRKYNKSGTLLTFMLTACFLLTACSPKKAEEGTPVIRQQLNDVQADLDAATRAAEERMQTACGESSTDC